MAVTIVKACAWGTTTYGLAKIDAYIDGGTISSLQDREDLPRQQSSGRALAALLAFEPSHHQESSCPVVVSRPGETVEETHTRDGLST